MAYFEFPHTRTYDSDLGWLIKHVRELISGYGSLAQWRFSHETEYDELRDIVEGIQHSLVEVIVPWDSSVAYKIYTIVEYQGTNYIAIQDVPVGTMITNTDYWTPANTVVEQINAIGNESAEMMRNLDSLLSPELAGVYMGDYINLTAHPQSVCQVNDDIYTLSAYDNQQNEGILRVFNITTNAEAQAPKTIVCGHANSLAYCPDNNSFYTTPIWDRDSGTAIKNYKIYKYDSSFTTRTVIDANHDMMSVSYDWATGILYALDYSRNIYTLDPVNDTLDFVENISAAFTLAPIRYNQDWAIYNGYWYASDPANGVISGHLGDTWFQPYNAARRDTSGARLLGELEGWEFNSDGQLIGCYAENLGNTYYEGTVVQFTNTLVSEIGPSGQNSKANFSYNLNDTTQAAFKLAVSELRSLRQISSRDTEAMRVVIGGNVIEDGAVIRLAKPLAMNFQSSGRIECGMIQMDGTALHVYGLGTIKPLTGTTAIFYSSSGADMSFAGSITIENDAAMDLVKSDNAAASIMIEDLYTSSNTLTVNGQAYRRGYYNNKYSQPIQILGGSTTVSVPDNADYADFSITFDRAFPTTPRIQLTALSTSTNYGRVVIPMIRSYTVNGFEGRVWKLPGYTATASNPIINWLAYCD